MLFPNQPDELKAIIDEVGFHPIHLEKRDCFLTKNGFNSLRRISDSIYITKQFKHLLNYNDITQAACSEIAHWINLGLIPDDDEFIPPLEKELSNLIDDYTFACKVDGVLLEDIDSIKVGSYDIRPYNPSLITELNQTSTNLVDTISRYFTNCYLIIGSEAGSYEKALEKFWLF